jgi:hypothetical protein
MGIATVREIAVPPPWTPEGHLRFHEWYQAMLAKGPVGLDEASGIWQFFGYDAVRDFLFRPENWSTCARIFPAPIARNASSNWRTGCARSAGT